MTTYGLGWGVTALTNANEMFQSQEIPGKGYGLVAVRDIQAGELVLSESPLILVPWWVRASQFPQVEKKKFLKEAVNNLDRKKREGFWQLHDSKVCEGDKKTLHGIWRTNNFSLGVSGPKADNGLFLEMSRFNHSCVPNAEFQWNSEKTKQEVRSIRDISEGSEITVCYFTMQIGVYNQQERKQFLESHYGFPCDCPACLLQDDDLKKDDWERGEVHRLESRIEDLFFDSVDDTHSCSSDVEDCCICQLKVGEDEKAVKEGINLCFIRLELMSRVGFKVVSQIRVCKLILDTALDWDLEESAVVACRRGVHLSKILYGPESKEYDKWTTDLKQLQL